MAKELNMPPGVFALGKMSSRVGTLTLVIAVIAILLSAVNTWLLFSQMSQIDKLSGTMSDLSLMVAELNPAYAANINWRQFEGEKVVVMVPKHMWTDTILPLIPEFKRLTGIDLEMVVYPEDLFYEKYWTAAESGKPPFDAAFSCPGFNTYPSLKMGALEPLDEYMNDPTLTDKAWYDWEDFPERVRDTAHEGTDKIYQLPLVIDNLGLLMYRKSVLAKHGLSVPETYEELVEAARKITEAEAPDMYGIVLRAWREFAWTGMRITMSSYIGPGIRGRGIYFQEDWTPKFNTQAAIDGIKLYSDLLKLGPPGQLSYTWYDAMDAFAAGRAAMIIDSNGFEYTFEDPSKSKVLGDVGYAVVPKSKYGHGTMLNFWCMVMMKGSEHKKAAWLFMQWVTSKDVTLEQGFAPARTSVLQDPAYSGKLPYGYADAMVESLKIAQYADGVYCDNNMKIFSEIGVALHDIFGGKDPNTAMQDLQQSAVKLLKEEGKLS